MIRGDIDQLGKLIEAKLEAERAHIRKLVQEEIKTSDSLDEL